MPTWLCNSRNSCEGIGRCSSFTFTGKENFSDHLTSRGHHLPLETHLAHVLDKKDIIFKIY
ncbi:hypothetical protein LINGRAHAP2_LOCUS15658 [Linum grandiflorum]